MHRMKTKELSGFAGIPFIGKMAQHAVEEGFATIGEAVFFTPKAHDVVGIATQRR